MSEVAQQKTRKPRFHGHEPFNEILRADWISAIKQSPDNFDAFLYRPVGEKANGSDDAYQKETVIEIDTNQDHLAYSDPELVVVLDCPDEQESFFMMDDGDENLGESLEPLMLRIASHHVPIGSVLEWDEETAGGVRTVWWYVHKAVGYGTANVGVIYICIPMRDFNQPPANLPELPDSSIESERETNELDSGFIEL